MAGHLDHNGDDDGDRLPPAPEPNQQQVTAKCHCGRVSLELPAPPRKINECRCSVCYRYGALWGYYRRDEVNIFVNILPLPPPPSPPRPSQALPTTAGLGAETAEEEKTSLAARDDDDIAKDPLGLRSYVRSGGDGDIAFFFCGHCGCLTHWGPTDKGLASLREQKNGDEPRVGINCRMIAPSLLEGVEKKTGKFQDFY